MDGVSGRPGVGSSGTQPPATATAYTGSYIAGLIFGTTGPLYFQGYWWWVPPGGDTGPVKCCLWQLTSGTQALDTVIAGSTVTSGTLSAGQWNYIPITTPLPLAQNTPYTAAVGYTATVGFPSTKNQFGVANPYASGIVNGPLYAPINGTQSASIAQSPFATASNDPTVIIPGLNDANDLLWLDVQVTDQAPTGITYRTFPNYPRPYPPNGASTDVTGYTLGMEFSLTRACSLQKIWHYSADTASGGAAVVLPTRCAIWDVSSQQIVTGTDNQTPSWLLPGGGAAAAGGGWVYCDYSSSGVILAVGKNYKVSTYHANGTGQFWFTVVPNSWGAGNPFGAGITQGPLVVPGNSGATPGQQSWNPGTWAYPNTSSSPEADFIDVEVFPIASGGSLFEIPLGSGME